MSCWKSVIKSVNTKNPANNPTHTSTGLWRLSFNLEERTRPPAIIAEIRYHSNGVNIFKERINTRPIRAPEPTACRDIFHQKLITVTINESSVAAKMNDFKNTGMGNLEIIYDVAQIGRAHV